MRTLYVLYIIYPHVMYICIYYIHKSASTFGTSKTSTHRCEWRQGLARWMLAATTCIGKMERIFGCSSVSVCEYALVSVWKILNVFCTLILFFVDLIKFHHCKKTWLSLSGEASSPRDPMSSSSVQRSWCRRSVGIHFEVTYHCSCISLYIYLSTLLLTPPRLGMRTKILWSNLMSLAQSFCTKWSF